MTIFDFLINHSSGYGIIVTPHFDTGIIIKNYLIKFLQDNLCKWREGRFFQTLQLFCVATDETQLPADSF